MGAKSTRRTFLGAAVPAALAGPRVLAGAASGANDAIVIGLIGCGGRGRHVMGDFQKLPGVRVAGVADLHRGRVRVAGVADLHRGRLAQGLKQTKGKAKTYSDYRKLLEDKSIDAVIVGTNGHWHALPAIDACAAGKDVYVEKPLATSIGEGRAVVKAARKYNRIVQIGTQQRSWEHYREAAEIVRSGMLGEISAVHVWDLENQYPGYGRPANCAPPPELDWDFWVGPSPKAPYNPNRYIHHYWFFDYGGGWELDWAVHHYDIVHWAMDVYAPVAAIGTGGRFGLVDDDREWPDTFVGACEYPPGPISKMGFLMNYTFRGVCRHTYHGARHGKSFHGTEGTLVLQRSGYQIYSEVRDKKKLIKEKDVPAGKENHAEVFLNCMRSRKRPEADVEIGHFASNPGHLMNISMKVGRRIRWDPKAERVIDDPQADALVTKKYRKPWVLPT